MRQARKILGLVVVATLLAAACGGNAENTTDTVSTDSAPADTTADDDDRDRNVGTSGFGENGGGVASVRLRDYVDTRIETRVFRRIRFEESGGRTVANFRDVFIVNAVTRSTAGVAASTIHVDGYTTEGDDPSTYPMKDFGDAGRVSVTLTDKSADWWKFPTGFSVVSRELLVVAFAPSDQKGDKAGLLEFYDLASGKPATNYGEQGRIVVPKTTGIDDIYDVSVRNVDDNGTPRLVVAGVSYDQEESVDNVVIVGIGADGRLDPDVGTNGSGTIALGDAFTNINEKIGWNLRLADNGLSQVTGVIGAIVSWWTPDPTVEYWKPGETEMTAIVARAPRSGGPITMDSANGAFVNNLSTGMSRARVRNLIFDSDYSLDAHTGGMPLDPTTMSVDETAYEVVSFSSASPTQGVAVRQIPQRFRTTNDLLSRTDRYVVDLSSEGKQFAVEVYEDTEDRKVVSVVCFSDQLCNVDGSSDVRGLIDISPNEGAWTSLSSMMVDVSGVHVLVRNGGTAFAGREHSIVTFAPDGSATIDQPTELAGDYETNNGSEVEQVDGTSWVNERWVDSPTILGPRRLAAIGSTLANSDPNIILLVDGDGEPRDVPLSLPLGITSWSALAHSAAMVDEGSIVATASVYSDSGREQRLYKVSVENGSVDVGFGIDGRASLPGIDYDSDDCQWRERLESGPGVVAALVIDHDALDINDVAECADTPSSISWATFTTTGRAVTDGWATADLTKIDFTRVSDHLVDARGNLYLIGFRDVYENNEYVTSNAIVVKFGPTGALDPSFGTAGVATFDGTMNALFGAGAEMVGTVDTQERVHLGAPIRDDEMNVDLLVMRLTTTGTIDGAVGAAADTPKPAESEAAPRRTQEKAEVAREAIEAVTAVEATNTERENRLRADSGLTVTTTKPVLTAVKAVADRSLTVWWSQPAAKQGYVTATAMPAGRTCTSNEGSCIIRGLDPSVAYTVTVAPKGEEAAGSASAESISVKPIVTLKLGRVASPTTYVRPASRGKATWKVRGGCTLNESNTRITAPRRATKCQLSVTTAKFESTPKTTKSVTIVVTK